MLKETIAGSLGGYLEDGAIINSSISKLKAYGISTYGPMIIWTCMKTDADKVVFERKYISQYLGDASKLPINFERSEPVRIGPCVHARYVGKEENVIRAFEKISVYAYENEIELKKENYTAYVEKNDSASTIDIFIPLEE